MKSFPLLATLSLLLVSCAGYQVGPRKPPSLEKVDTISISVFENDTLHPRAEVLATSAVASAVTLDGSYRIVPAKDADAVLEGTVRRIDYDTIRSRRFNALRPEELENRVLISWVLRDAKDPTQVLASGTANGESQLFVSSNLQTARQNALPEAMERAGEQLVSRIANGF
ncbi:MAG: LPS assembly lipoprotein LptE [Akkermansiaceae bacterium]|nr:LPS assembly lipoprotein LptE [Akkermansiaceae bacterium]